MKSKILAAAAAAFLCSAGTAQAEWYEARSANFTVYGDMSQEKLREWAVTFERYDKLMRAVSHVEKPPSENPLEIYLVPDSGAVHRAANVSGTGRIGGFYWAVERGPYSVGSVGLVGERFSGLSGRHTMQHEYTHHFMFQYSPAAYPSWYVEGFAEFYGMSDLGEGNEIEIGVAPAGRVENLRHVRWVDWEKMLAEDNTRFSPREFAMLYAQGWLLLHAASFNPQIGEKVNKYIGALNAGSNQRQAFNTAFGERGGRELTSFMRDYFDEGRIKSRRIALNDTAIGEIKFRRLTPAEQALVELDFSLNSRISRSDVREFAERARREIARFPNDPFALRLLAEVELRDRRYDAAIAAVDRLIAVDPDNARGLAVRGVAMANKLIDTANYDKAAWDEARSWLIRSNRADPKDAWALLNYYTAFESQNVDPTPNAVQALYRAYDLIPQNPGIRFLVASQLEKEDRLDAALNVIMPVASDPHEAEKAEEEARKNADRKIGPDDIRIRSFPKQTSDMVARLREKQANEWTDAEEAAFKDLVEKERLQALKDRNKDV